MDASGLTAKQRGEIQKITGDRRSVMPNQYIGKGPEAEEAAREIAKMLKGAKVYNSTQGASTSHARLWERVAHGLIDRIFKGRK